MAEDPAWEQHVKTVTTTVRAISAEGVTLEMNYQGETKGKLKAQITGTMTLWTKPDGTWTWEDKLLGGTATGDRFVGWGKGSGKPTGGASMGWEGEFQTMSASPALSWLNNAKFRVHGAGDGTGPEAKIQFHHVK